MNSKFLIAVSLLMLLSYQENICTQNSYNQKKEEPKNIVIIFHLYNLYLMDEFIVRINKFMELNDSENFYIKICVPVAQNVDSYSALSDLEKSFVNQKQAIYKQCIKAAPYHPKVITYKNCIRLFAITQYLKENLKLEPEKIQIIFSENRGVDLGSFLLLLDQMIQENLQHDFIVKLHTKTLPRWREKLLKILDVKISDVLKTKECVYACNRLLSPDHPVPYERTMLKLVLPQVKEILKYYKVPCPQQMSHCAGTMFIVSSKLTNFLKKYDRIKLYNRFNIGFPGEKAPLLEHGLEVGLGYFFEYLQLDTLFLSDYLSENVYGN